MKILLTGATGFIGSRFCRRAAEAGHSVRALVRPQSLGRLPDGLSDTVVGQLPFDVPEAAWHGVDAVVHAAAVTTSGAAAESHATNLLGTNFLVSLAAAAGVGRFVFISTQSVFSPSDAAYAVTKRSGEDTVRASGLSYAIVRPGLVYGSGPSGLFGRMRATVRKLPVLPLLGGGKAIIQGIDVEDLCSALLRCLDLPGGESGEFNLGDPDGVTLADFLGEVALAETGRPKMRVSIPLWPVKLGVAVGEALRLPLPISRDNVKGMETVQRMDTRASLERLGITLPPWRDSIRAAVQSAPPPTSATSPQPVRILLCGAGKIGIIHALSFSRREKAQLVAIVDRQAGALAMYRGMGFDAAYETDLDAAIAHHRPDGVVVATPASTHPGLTRKLVQQGLAVLVEKPYAISDAALAEVRAIRKEFAQAIIHVGYMAAQYPHLATMRQLLQEGAIGSIQSVYAWALQSHIMASKPVRWEMIKAQAGGGVLINFAGHVLSMLLRLFGAPVSSVACMKSVYSTEVEDAATLTLQWPEFAANFATSWSLPGYPTPDNQIVVVGSSGTLVLTNAMLVLERNGHTEQVWSQRSYDVGYNPAPDYTGAGFAAEHRNFIEAIIARRDGTPAAVAGLGACSDEEAWKLESFLFGLYTGPQDPAAGRGVATGHQDMHAQRYAAILKKLDGLAS